MYYENFIPKTLNGMWWESSRVDEKACALVIGTQYHIFMSAVLSDLKCIPWKNTSFLLDTFIPKTKRIVVVWETWLQDRITSDTEQV